MDLSTIDTKDYFFRSFESLIIEAPWHQLRFHKIIVIFSCLLGLVVACKKDKGNELEIRSVVFYGCTKNKAANDGIATAGCANFSIDSRRYLKINRTNVKLNCGVDSLILNMDHSSNSISIYETGKANPPAYCNCYMSFDYTIGPLNKSNYEINIHSAAGDIISFIINKDDVTGKICE